MSNTEVVAVDPDNPDPGVIARAAELIRRGRLVAFPTETVYGLGANALDEAAVRSIFEAKQRDPADPLIVHIARARDLEGVVAAVTEHARRLGEQFWPGPLTLVLERGERVAAAVSAGLDTVAVRVPGHPVALALIEAAGVPVAAPSANRFMRTSATTAGHVLADLDGRIDLVLDGGPTRFGVESTVVDARGPRVRLLRPGAVTLEQLRDVAGGDVEIVSGAGPSASPGTLSRHYAPSTPLRFLEGDTAALAAAVEGEVAAGRSPGVLCTRDEAPALDAAGATVEILGDEGDFAAMAHNLFAAIRRLDQANLDVILVRDYGDRGLARTIRDRLRRAATPGDGMGHQADHGAARDNGG